MPEGDTLFRVATRLAPALTGKAVVRAISPLPRVQRALEGRTIAGVEAVGKNLLIRLDDGRTLRTHLRMNGAWHVYRSGERWHRAEWRARVAIDVGTAVAVCFDAPVVEIVDSVEEHPPIAALGPDLLSPSFDEDEALRRVRSLGDRAIGEAVMEQRAIAGIGNIYKSETLFACRVDPFAKVSSLDDDKLRGIVQKGRELLKRNAIQSSVVRTTRTGGRFFVYGRSGRPCFVCGDRVRMRRQSMRSTYYCPTCQKTRERHVRG